MIKNSKIAFAAISKSESFEIKKNDNEFNGIFYGNLEKKQGFILCNGNIKGTLAYNCDRCSNDMTLDVNLEVNLLLYDGIYKDNTKELLDVVEFFNGYIDLEYILESETQSFKSDYFYCDDCEKINL